MTARASDAFHPLLRHHLVNTLGWHDLRPLQELAAGPVLHGEHALILAPTAGGKTEAAILPTISNLLTEHWPGTSILYLCPLKALLNNLHERMETYFGMVGYQAGLWHGDISTSERQKIVVQKPACLMTTPESLEVMLVSRRKELKELLAEVKVVIVDEIHAFAGDDRGLHLLSVLDRIVRFSGKEFQRLGLSATVGNPDSLLEWLAGPCEGKRSVISVSATSSEADVTVDYVGTLENASIVISQLYPGEKRLVFCDSRRRVEELAVQLRKAGTQTFISHSSLSAEQRREAEEAFRDERDCVIVATSTLELGIDVGDLDRVIQIDAPGSVASFLQRIGRTGRRTGSSRNCLFLATSDSALLQACALVSLWESGFVEPIVPPGKPFHIFVQQILALTLQTSGLPRHAWADWIGRMKWVQECFLEQKPETIIDHLVTREILSTDGVLLWIGDEGEKKFGRRHFLELVSVFTATPMFEVCFGSQAIGQVDWLSIAVGDSGSRKPIVLGGKSWQIESIDFKLRRIFVSPSKETGRARWQGMGPGMSFPLAQAIRNQLLESDMPQRWTERAQKQMVELRARFLERGIDSTAPTDAEDGGIVWWNFAGGPLNELIATAIESESGISAAADDYGLRFSSSKSASAIREVLSSLLLEGNLIERLNLVPDSWLDGLKFSQCLPRELAMQAAIGRVKLNKRDLEQLRGMLAQR